MVDGTTPTGKRRRVPREKAPTTPDPIEIAMEAEAKDTSADSPARRLLIDQGRLVRLQIAKERAAFAGRSLLALAGLAIALLFAAMVWRAASADGLVIQTIEAPADLQAQGFTGRALAAQLQDKLSRMQGETHTPGRAANLREGSADDIRIEIPNTGVSLDEVDRLFRSWLSRETTVTGEIAEPRSGPDAGALVLTVRVGNAPGGRVLTRTGDMDALLAAGAEQVYEVHALEGYLRWLMSGSRRTEALPIARAHADTGPANERAAALYAMAWVDPDLDQAARIDLFRRAVLVNPRYCAARIDLGARQAGLGRYEAALKTSREAMACTERDPSLTAEGRAFSRSISMVNIAGNSGDAAGILAGACMTYGVTPCTPQALQIKVANNASGLLVDPGFRRRLSEIAGGLAFAHAPEAGQRLADLPRTETSATIQQIWISAEARIAFAHDDWQGFLDKIEAWNAFVALAPKSNFPTSPSNWRALALAKLGRRDEAMTATAAAPPPADCYPCLYVRGETAALGDHPGAERWFAEAARQGPSIPIAYEKWARARLARGDAVGALKAARWAVKLGPRNVDALEALGEVQMAQGDNEGAAATFATAAAITPWWGRLHLKWGEALAKLGKADEARAKFTAAAGMDLTAAERAEVTALLQKRTS